MIVNIMRNGKFVACVLSSQIDEHGYVSTLSPFLSERDRRCLERGFVRLGVRQRGSIVPVNSKGKRLLPYYFENVAD